MNLSQNWDRTRAYEFLEAVSIGTYGNWFISFIDKLELSNKQNSWVILAVLFFASYVFFLVLGSSQLRDRVIVYFFGVVHILFVMIIKYMQNEITIFFDNFTIIGFALWSNVLIFGYGMMRHRIQNARTYG